MAASHDREAFIDARRTDTMTALHFEIRVAGTVPADVLAELDDVRIITQSVETVLRGPVPDQAALIGIINRLQGWGIELHAVRPHITGLGQAEWHHRHDGAGGRVPVSTAVPSPGLHPVVSDRCTATCAPSVLCGRTCFTVGKMGALTNDTRRAKFQRKRKFRRSVPTGRSARCRPSRSSGCESAQRADPLRPSKVLARVTQFPLGW